MEKKEKLAIVRIRGRRKIDPLIKRVLDHLRLIRVNHCIIVDDSPAYRGAIQKIKDYVTFGTVTEETIYHLLLKRGEKGSMLLKKIKKEAEIKHIAQEITSGKKLSEFIDPVFRLHGPSGGHKDIKLPYPQGSLGKRDDMDKLLGRMM